MSLQRSMILALMALVLSAQALAGPPGPGGPGGPGWGNWGPGPGGGHGHGLPDGARELWIGSALYFVAAGTYYLWNTNAQRYEVATPPPTVQSSNVASYEVIAYPASGQSAEQQGRDRYECHGWAVGQSGFDPATANAPVSAESTELYRRALGACLAGRGYSIN